jgi:hypothetical protein
VAALRRTGMRAPCTLDGATNGQKFFAYVKHCLAPTLRGNDIVGDRQSSRAQARWYSRGD